MDKILDNYIDTIKNEIIHSTCEIINIPSVYDNTNPSVAPFGINTVKALEYILDLGKKFGFRTKNIDNKCGYIEFGEGDKLLGIIGHLDVVPADDNWTFSPFDATISNNNIYGRGAIDDKGPVIAALYAMKAVHDNYKLDKRVRLILGLNEETNWECIERYKQTEEIPTISFSPDANFPCIYAEKTIETIYIREQSNKNASLYIEELSTNNNAINVVPKFCEATLNFDETKIKDLSSTINNVIKKYNYNINLDELDSSHIKLTSHGMQAHASHPELGNNAISKLIIVLNEIFNFYNQKIDILNYFSNYIGDDFSGTKLGLNFEDESGKLTLNTAHFFIKDSYLYIGFNLRIPVTVDYNIIKDNFEKYFTENLEIEIQRIQEPLYINPQDSLVQKLCTIFNDYNNSNLPPEVIGGGTYARAFSNCVSFGPQMPGSKDMCHQSDEYISIDNLLFCTKVYAKTITEL